MRVMARIKVMFVTPINTDSSEDYYFAIAGANARLVI
jgi:hypothetical protein